MTKDPKKLRASGGQWSKGGTIIIAAVLAIRGPGEHIGIIGEQDR